MLTGYAKDNKTGAIYQEDLRVTAVYDTKYVANYVRLPVKAMSLLRWNTVKRALVPLSIQRAKVLDFGCGTGSFLSEVHAEGARAYGHDIADYPLPAEIHRVDTAEMASTHFDLVTFFDSLEHVVNPLHTLVALDTEAIAVSLPWCHANTLGSDWFFSWKHRKPGEHLWHFDAASLCKLAGQAGFRPVFVGNPEDAIRYTDTGLPNILTGVFIRD